MASGPKLVHKQFNSPIGLYSQHNIQETLNKHLKNLDNGTVGIDFNKTDTDKPPNLANSAVLRMLEEEEREKKGYPKLDPTQVQAILDTLVHNNHRFDTIWPPQQARMKSARSWDGHLNANSNIYSEFLKATSQGAKKVVWPPVPETNGYHSSQQSPGQQQQEYSAPNQYQQQQYQPPSQQYQPPSQQYQPPSQHYQPPSYQHKSPGQQYQTATQQQQAPAYNQTPTQQYPAQSNAVCEGKQQGRTGLSRLIPVGPGVTAAPTSYRPGPPSPAAQPQPFRQQNSRWAPVPAPLSPQGYNSSQQSYPSQPYSPQHSPYSQSYSEPTKTFSPPPTTITLRQHQPVHQKPSPVFASQPAAASYKGGVNMRGDTKWPPQTVREAVEAENEARRQLAKGPACRPRKVRKDYTQFFAQNALNHNNVGYRAPPGTQHYEENSGRSSY